jgi:hypothetical protein
MVSSSGVIPDDVIVIVGDPDDVGAGAGTTGVVAGGVGAVGLGPELPEQPATINAPINE